MSWKNNVVVELFFEKICQKFRSVTHEINPWFYVGCYFEYLLLFVTAWLLDSHAQYKCTPGSNKYGTGAIHQEKNFKVTQFNYNSNSKKLNENKMWKKVLLLTFPPTHWRWNYFWSEKFRETSSRINPPTPMIFFEVAKKHGKYKKGLENGVMRVRNVFYVNLCLIMQWLQ